jgi:predicted AAA+ superfamily ATPase
MKLSEIEKVASEQRADLLAGEEGLPREMLSRLPDVLSHALIVSGIRRCGKSTLLAQHFRRGTDFFYFNFEDLRLYDFTVKDFALLNTVIERSGSKTLFFDEIQNVEGWELFVRQKLNAHFKVAVTGSNATLLSQELGTRLTGRHITKELFPFSYREFIAFTRQDAGTDSLLDYLARGGFPDYLKTGVAEVLKFLVDDIVYRDIVVRHGLRDAAGVRRLLGYILANAARLVSPSRLTGVAGVKSATTVLDYFSLFEAAYLVSLVPCFSYSAKAQALAPKKMYVCDTGLIRAGTVALMEDRGHLLENLVFMHFRRRGSPVFYFSGEGGECDFVEVVSDKPERLVQVCWELTADNEGREIGGLTDAMRYFGKKNGTIVTCGRQDRMLVDDMTIDVVPAHQFLLADEDQW